MKNSTLKKEAMNIALAMIVKGTDNEAKVLKNCLKYIRPHVDGAYITITQPNEEVKKVCELFECVVSEYEWDNNFAKARNFNFSQVPKEYEYIFWCDADDAIRNAELIKKTIEENPKVDCFSMNYLYAFDEWKNPIVVHQKTRIVRNDGCVKWAGNLHEDFSENRALKRFFIKGIDVLHMTDDDRVNESRNRNIEVAREGIKTKPNDPRSYWNLGNSLKFAGEAEEAIRTLKKFNEMSLSDEERYMAYMRIAECYISLNDLSSALDSVRMSVGIRPEYPDAYHLMGHIYFDKKDYERAMKSYLDGLTKKPPYYNIIAYNPRDYDYTPLMALAKTYFHMNRPMLALECLKGCKKIYPQNKGLDKLIKDMQKQADDMEKALMYFKDIKDIKDKKKLKEKMDMLPNEVKRHPLICNVRNINFIKEKSSGKDVVIYCNATEKEWTPQTALTGGVGGSEEAVINISRELAKEGYNVTVYNSCGHKKQVFDGVVYEPYWAFNYRDKQDIVILWRSLIVADYDINAEKIFVDLHDCISPGELTKSRLQKIDKIFVKSRFHRSLFPDVGDEKFVIIPNGLNTDLFSGNIQKDPHLIINTSSPDRSLSALLEVFPRIKEKIPEMKLKWAYGWDIFDIVHSSNPEAMKWKRNIQKKMKDMDGVEDLGRINHKEVARLYKKGNIFLYPTEFAEIDCISARKAQLAGCYPVTTDFAALFETVRYGHKVRSNKNKSNWCEDYQFDFAVKDKKMLDEFVDIIVSGVPKDREEMKEWAGKFTWEYISKVWIKEFQK